ncbi:hypothetical protein NDN11_11690 [Acinetobacter sp. C26M]|uniref:Uncharacterized protein n=1 Tax=Acinetobacter dispersus TaxID=70348 RepID=N9MEG6_9GAMM|nr:MULTISPECIES: hypothetical protein [Acinetobacter]ENW91570.1 hypothetical protein F904_01507 [Acinetobacter dispersus]USA45384.1 hypothetical protein NDN11_11690 [Acinetobacter sp. C26M]USA48886.1 hypothetical protein NDN12_11690 [Acinetobacter sp. C26G]
MVIDFLKKKKSVASYFKFQYMVLQNEVNILKVKSQKAEDSAEKSRKEYLSVVKDISELQSSFGFSLGNKTYDDGLIVIDVKYNEFISNQNISEELKKELHEKMHLLVLQKRKIDHLNDIIKEHHFFELQNNLGE